MGPDADPATRVLVVAPVGRDAQLTRELLERAGIASAVFGSLAAVAATFEQEGAGALLLTEEALDDRDLPVLVAVLERQPSWSDVSVLLFAGTAGSEMVLRTNRFVETLRNVTLLERPIRLAAVRSAVKATLRSRERQYQVRDLLAKLSQARAEAESSNRLKDEFLATLSHELRTPLNAILGWTSMLTRGQVDPSRMPHVFEALERNAQSQAQLIADVLDVSRIVTGKLLLEFSTVDVADAVTQAAEAVRFAAAKDIELTIAEGCGVYVRGDVDRLRQILWNLLSNAVKFTPKGGSIRVTFAREGPSVCLSVTDNGAGISPRFLPFVFDRFRQEDQTTTRTHGGLGLGLSIVKHLAELHGGTITAASAGLEQGATFRLVLPAADPPAGGDPPRRASEERTEVWLGVRSILVVDDDAATREVVTAVLEHAGARVRVASSAAEARQALADPLPFDMVVADLAMPVEDGLSLLRHLRASSGPLARVPAIALSAHADRDSEQAARAAGFTAFLPKPARPEALLRLVSELLSAPFRAAEEPEQG